MLKVVIEVKAEGPALLEASESLIKMAEALQGSGSIVVAPPTEAEEESSATMEVRPPSPGAVAELDADGRPWDGRIDSSGKTKTQDGRWKLKKGADKTLVADIKSQYAIATVAPPPPPAAPVAPPAPAEAAAPPPPPAEPVMTEKANGITYDSYIAEGWSEEQLIDGGYMLPRGETIDKITVNVVEAPVTYEMITDKITVRVDSGELQPGELEGILLPFSAEGAGVLDLPTLNARPELWAPVYTKLAEAWG